jgi:hypothetical protein
MLYHFCLPGRTLRNTIVRARGIFVVYCYCYSNRLPGTSKIWSRCFKYMDFYTAFCDRDGIREAVSIHSTELVKLTTLMDRTGGIPEVKIGLIDGTVATQLPDLMGARFREIPGNKETKCTQANSTACVYGPL